MAIISLKCKQCGGQLEFDNEFAKEREYGFCRHCGTKFLFKDEIINQTFNYQTTIIKNISGSEKTDAEELILSAETLISLGEWQKAKNVFEKAIETYPSDWRTWFGMVKYHTGNFCNLKDTQHYPFLEKARKVCQVEQIKELNEIYRIYIEKIESEKQRLKKEEEEHKKELERLRQEKIRKWEENALKRKKIFKFSGLIACGLVLLTLAIFLPLYFTKEQRAENTRIRAEQEYIENNTYTINYTYSDEYGVEIIKTTTYVYGRTIPDFVMPEREGYNFTLYTNATFQESSKFNFSVKPAEKTIELFVKWVAETYTLVFNSQGGSSVVDKTVTYGVAIGKLIVPEKMHHNFGGWWTQPFGEGVEFTIETMPKQSLTLYANWILIYTSGSGTQNDPLIISTKTQFEYFAERINAGNSYNGIYFALSANINLNREEWVSIDGFSGYFNGCGFAISNFIITDGRRHIGLFGSLSGSIKNLNIHNFAIDIEYSNPTYIGSLVGFIEQGGSLENCHVSSGMVKARVENTQINIEACIGGLVGRNLGTLEECSTMINVDKAYIGETGGLIGSNSGIVKKCYSTGNTTVVMSYNYDSTGGLIGSNGGIVEKCYSTGNTTVFMSEFGYVGGLIGYNSGGTAKIINSYSAGNINSINANAGGLVGCNLLYATIENSYSATNITAISTYFSGYSNYMAIGGLVGSHIAGANIINCLAVGEINATSISEVIGNYFLYAGGLIGHKSDSSIDNSYRYLNQVIIEICEGNSSIGMGGNSSGILCTLEHLNSKTFYTSMLGWSDEVWDFSELELLVEKFPILKY